MSDQEIEINIFDNFLNEIEVFKKVHEVTKKLESFLDDIRPRGAETTKLYNDMREFANKLRRVEDGLFIYIGDVSCFADETLEGIESLNEENFEDFLEDTTEGIEGLCRRYDDSLEIYNKALDILLKFKNMAAQSKEDMKNVGTAAITTELFGPQAVAAVRQILSSALPNSTKALSFLSNFASWMGPVASGAAVGCAVGKAVPTDNIYGKVAAGATSGIATTALCFWLVSLACPQLNACLSIGSAVSAMLAYDHRSELTKVVRSIDKVNNSVTNHKATISALKQHIDRAVNVGERVQNRRIGYEGNLDRTRKILRPLERALRDLQQKFGNNRQALAMLPSSN